MSPYLLTERLETVLARLRKGIGTLHGAPMSKLDGRTTNGGRPGARRDRPFIQSVKPVLSRGF